MVFYFILKSHIYFQFVLVKYLKYVKVAQSCLTLCVPVDYTVHGILKATVLELCLLAGQLLFGGVTFVRCY